MTTHVYTLYRSKFFDSHPGLIQEHGFHFLVGTVLLMIFALLPRLGLGDMLDEQLLLLEKSGLATGVVSQALRGICGYHLRTVP